MEHREAWQEVHVRGRVLRRRPLPPEDLPASIPLLQAVLSRPGEDCADGSDREEAQVASREELRAAIRETLERATPDDDFALVLQAAAVEQSRLLGGMLTDDDGDQESRYLLGWLHLYRYYALPAGQDQQQYDTAVELFARCFAAGAAGLPESLLPDVVRRAVRTANRLLEQAQAVHDRDLAGNAVGLWRRIVEATAAGDPARADRVSRLGLALLTGYQRTGEPADLDEAVQVLRTAADATPGNDPVIVARRSNLAVALLTRFDRTESADDLQAAIELARGVVAGAGADDPDRAMYLSNLGAALCTRSVWTGRLADLDEGVSTQQAAVAATPAGHRGLPRHLTNLAIASHTRFQHTGSLADSAAAIEAQRAAIDAAPPGHPDLAAMLSNLAGLAAKRFARTGEMSDLDAAIEAGRDAVNATRDGDPGQAGHMSNLGNALEARYERTGRLADLDEAIAHHRDAVAACPADERNRAGCLNNLGTALMARFQRTAAMTDLDAAIEAGEGAVSAVPDDHPDRARYLSNLGIKVHARFGRSGERSDLEAAIAAGTAAVDAAPAGHPDRAKYLSNLAITVFSRVGEDGRRADLDEAIRLEQEAVDATPAGHPSRAGYLTVLGLALRVSAADTGAAAELGRAVELLRAAADATPRDDPQLAGRLASLADTLTARFEQSRADQDSTEAAAAYEEAVRQELAGPSVRIRAARAAAALIARSAPGRAAGLLESAVRLLGEVIPRELARGDQQYQIREFAGLASDAAALALGTRRRPAAARAGRALSLLESGRAVLLSQMLEIRDDVTDLRMQYPELAERLTGLRERLDQRGSLAAETAETTAAPGRAAEERRRRADELTATLRQIRAIKGFAAFGLPPAVEELTAQAAAGPVVTVNVSDFRSDALLLTTSGVTAVRLPGLTRDALTEAIGAFHQAIGAATAGEAGHQDRMNAQQAMTAILGWMWDVVAEPVLEELGFRQSPAAGTPWPRMWWAPGGLLGQLPIHAAGRHQDGPPAAAVMDRIISSYTPTIRALRYARQHARQPASAARALIVAMPVTPGLPGDAPLPDVPAEVRAIRPLLPEPVILIEPSGTKQGRPGVLPTRANVFRYLPQCVIGHFACHGASHPSDPSQSMLLLHDHQSAPLTVSSLTSVLHDNLRLSYLSACRTAYTADSDLLDESIHLTSAFQLAGSRHVIGTLWEINDTTAAAVAASFYAGLRTAAGELDTDRAARALHDAVRAIRDRYPRSPVLWAGYLHAGALSANFAHSGSARGSRAISARRASPVVGIATIIARRGAAAPVA
jgi:hypothetical protein